MAEKVRVGIIGCGAISGAYLKHAKDFPLLLDIVAAADLKMEAAKQKAAEYGIPRVLTVDELLKDDQVEVVLNLTIPKAHVPVALQAIDADKHVYAEKPLGINRQEAKQVMDAAAKRRLVVGCAPDTVLGAGIQTARKVIDDGIIGRPVGFTAFMLGKGHEHWHPNPEFYYQLGGGPMFDMGPYYLTALLNLLGPVRRINGVAKIEIPDRVITSEPLKGRKIDVQTPDHIFGTMEFQGMPGAVGVIGMSFAVRYRTDDNKQPITIFGTKGTLKVPDPNQFDGPVHVRTDEDEDWREVPHATPTGFGRALGLADMAEAIRGKWTPRCSGQQALAVVDLMEGFLDSSNTGTAYKPTVDYVRPDPMPSWPR
jgi:predicted dehydrogenase